jgi:hypothetical protein
MAIAFCEDHWDMLRMEIKGLGLEQFVATDGEMASMQLVDQINKGEITAVNFDPLMGAMYMIVQNTIESIGMRIMLVPQEECPICVLNTMRTEDGACGCGSEDCGAKEPGSIPPFETWLAHAAEGQRDFAIERGWISDPAL